MFPCIYNMERTSIPIILGIESFYIQPPKWNELWPEVKTPLLGCVMAILGRYIYFKSVHNNRLIFLKYLDQLDLKIPGNPTTEEVREVYRHARSDKSWQTNVNPRNDQYMEAELMKFLNNWRDSGYSHESSMSKLDEAHQRGIISDWVRDMAIIFYRGNGWMDICPRKDRAVNYAFDYLNEVRCKYVSVEEMINDPHFAGRRTELFWYLCHLIAKVGILL